MSAKVIDPDSLLKQLRPSVDARDRRLFEKRIEEEHAAELAEALAISSGSAPVKAELVYSEQTGKVGVAVHGSRFVCQLPKGYGGPGCEMIYLPDGTLLIAQPDKTPLLIDPDTGKTRRL